MNIKTLFSIGIIFLFSSMFTFPALDLAFTTAITQSPDPVSAGVEATFTVSFRTNGGAVTNFKIIGGVGVKQYFERTYAAIPADNQRTDTFTWTAMGGNQTVWFELDPNHTCGDSNYTNNRIEKAITVSGKPDLKLYVDYAPKNFKHGTPITLSITVLNTGDAASAPSKLSLSKGAGNLAFAVLDVPEIEAVKNWKTTYQWNVDCDVNLRIVADAGNLNDELNENNNIWTKLMKCIEIHDWTSNVIAPAAKETDPNGPDLLVKITKIDYVSLKNKIWIFVEVSNIGVADSAPCELLLKSSVQPLAQASRYGIDAIPAGGKQETSVGWSNAEAVKLIFVVDYNNKNIEINEANNTLKWDYAPEMNR